MHAMHGLFIQARLRRPYTVHTMSSISIKACQYEHRQRFRGGGTCPPNNWSGGTSMGLPPPNVCRICKLVE